MSSIRTERLAAIVVLTIDNEPRRNAFTHDMSRALERELRAAEDDPDVRCVVVTGAGDVAFSSGHDLREMLDDREHASDASANACFVLPAAMRTPCIAAVNGHAYAAGLILSLSCDLRVCVENATFAAPGSRLGLLPIGGQLSRLPRLLPRAIAHEMLVAGRVLASDDALRYGFVNRVVPTGQARDAAIDIARRIAAQSPAVVREVKEGLDVLDRDGREAASAFEWSKARELQTRPDAAEGMTAFLEKREPVFGRAP